jgi:uncharacterized membrane protein (DUF485 family)
MNIDFARRTLVVIFSLLLLADLLFGLMAFGTGHKIPPETTISILIAAVVLVILAVLTHKYLRRKNTD